jgi:hypothetical protein
MGPYIDSPVIIRVLNDTLSDHQAISELQLGNLRHIVELYPEARTDYNAFTEHLRVKIQHQMQGQAV